MKSGSRTDLPGLSREELFRTFHLSDEGLSSIEAKARLLRFGKNQIEFHRGRSPWLMLLEEFRELFPLLLMVAALLAFFTNHLSPNEGYEHDLPYRTQGGTDYLTAKGESDVIIERYTHIHLQGLVRPLHEGDQLQSQHHAAQSMQVLALAYKVVEQADAEAEDLVIIGLVAMVDTPHPEVSAAVAACKSAGIRIIVTYEYDQSLMAGPPFSVTGDEIQQHFATTNHLKMLEHTHLERGLKEKISVVETTWLLQKSQ